MGKSTKILIVAFLIAQSSMICFRIVWPKNFTLLDAFAPTIALLIIGAVFAFWLSFVTGFWNWVFSKKSGNGK